MTLFQLSSILKEDKPIVIFSLNGVEMFRCRYKKDIPSEFMDFTIFNLSIGYYSTNRQELAFYITLQAQ